MLTTRFMTIAEQRHKVPKISKRVFAVFVKCSCRFVRFVVKEYFRVTLLTFKFNKLLTELS